MTIHIWRCGKTLPLQHFSFFVDSEFVKNCDELIRNQAPTHLPTPLASQSCRLNTNSSLQSAKNKNRYQINMSYLTDSYIVFTLKMESVFKNTIFSLKMMVKSGLEKFILKSFPAGRLFLLLNLWFWALLWSKGK